MNNTWSPSFLVKQTHSLLHLDTSLQSVSNDFNISFDSYLNDYSKSLVPLPVLLMALGLISILALQITHYVRFCSKICCCSTGDLDVEAIRTRKNLTSYRVFFFGLLSAAAVALFTDQILIFGSASLGRGVDDSQGAVDYVHDLAVTLNDEGEQLLEYGDRILDNFAKSSASTTCIIPNFYNTYVYDFKSYVDEFLGDISPIPGQCEVVNDGLETWGVTYKNQSIWVLYGVLIACVFFYALGLYVKSRLTVQVSLGLSELLMILFFIVIGVELVLLMVFADFCMDPIYNTLSILPRDVYDVASYYTTCTGVNPLQSSIDTAEGYVTDMEVALNALLAVPTCTNNPYVLDSLAAVHDIQDTINKIVAEVECEPTNEQLTYFLQTGLCDNSFLGIFLIWIGQYLTTSLLLLCSILATFLLGKWLKHFWLSLEEESFAAEVVLEESVRNPSAEGIISDSFVPSTNPSRHAEEHGIELSDGDESFAKAELVLYSSEKMEIDL